MSEEIKILIAAPPDREHHVAMIDVGHEQIAEINRELGTYRIEIYPARSGEPWQLDVDEFIETLVTAKARLEEWF